MQLLVDFLYQKMVEQEKIKTTGLKKQIMEKKADESQNPTRVD